MERSFGRCKFKIKGRSGEGVRSGLYEAEDKYFGLVKQFFKEGVSKWVGERDME